MLFSFMSLLLAEVCDRLEIDPRELLQLRDRYRHEVQAELHAERMRRGLPSARIVRARMH